MNQQQGQLQKKIGAWSAVTLIIGSIIGSGVFMKPSSMAAELGSPIWLTVVWIIAGIFTLFGALIYAELGAMMPETGGIYVYFRKMFGDPIENHVVKLSSKFGVTRYEKFWGGCGGRHVVERVDGSHSVYSGSLPSSTRAAK